MPTFNEADLCLLREWTDARLLEDAMEAIRDKYKLICDRVLDEFLANHPGLSFRQPYYGENLFSIGAGKSSWFRKENKWTSGFWIEDLRLDTLTSPELERPYRMVWICEPRLDPKETEARLRKEALRILRKEDLRDMGSDSNKRSASLWWYLEQPRRELFELLIKEDGAGFISCMVDHFERMAKFTAFVDQIFARSKRAQS
jgi:hypothetical protein